MRYELHGIFFTHSDFMIDVSCFEEQYKKHVMSMNDVMRYEISYKTESTYSLMMFLEQLIVSYRVNYPHYALLPKLIEMTMYIHEIVKEQSIKNGTIIKSLEDDDYEGTELMLEIKQ